MVNMIMKLKNFRPFKYGLEDVYKRQAFESLGTKVFFAHPYSAWERPINERSNRILRRYIPKGTSIQKYSDDEILMFADEINALPRKRLHYHTPEELFDAHLDCIYALR